ncbi:hypothetical protein Agub_g7694, partial [Astrephomene gubernaculifera]
ARRRPGLAAAAAAPRTVPAPSGGRTSGCSRRESREVWRWLRRNCGGSWWLQRWYRSKGEAIASEVAYRGRSCIASEDDEPVDWGEDYSGDEEAEEGDTW